MISLIWAMDRNRTIGRDNRLPWRLPADLGYFKRLTLGHTVIMGRKTFESMGKPLPGRNNVVITRDKAFTADGCTVVHSIEASLELGRSEEVFIIGGAEIYSKFFKYADRLYITRIEEDFTGDTFFHEIDFSEWTLVSKTQGVTDEKNPYEYYFLVYDRK